MRVSRPLAGRAAAWYEKSFRLNFERVEMAPSCGVMCGRQTSANGRRLALWAGRSRCP
jgi:hypothetical protein